MKDFASGTVSVSDWCPSKLSEGSRRAFASSGEAESGQNDTNIGPICVPGKPKVVYERLKSNLIRRISCFLVREVHVGSI